MKKIIVGACSFADLIPEGWTVVEDVAPSVFDVSKMKPVSFLKEGESFIGGEEMRKRAIELKGNLGLADGQRMLDEPNKIPVELRNFSILLPGTVLRDLDGHLRVSYLSFLVGRWIPLFHGLVNDWDDNDRFACCE